jgi:four helix bundle protein
MVVGSWKWEVKEKYLKRKLSFKFEKLIIWQKAMDLGEDMNKLAKNFPKEEVFNLASQLRRSADSIALNISEGAIGQSSPEFKKFMGYAIRSLAEVVTCLYKAKKRNYIKESEFIKHYEYSYNLMNMMIAFKNKIN